MRRPVSDPEARDKLVRNERLKLTASWLNTLAGASMAAGVIAPLAAALFGVAAAPVPTLTLGLGVLIFFLVGVGLHVFARLVLKGLRP
jgi:hypothetical protein